MSLAKTLQQMIQKQKRISFAELMQVALYAPQEGYYSSMKPKFGPSGDFITAPELSPLFGKTLASQCQQIFACLSQPSLLEFGAGSGALCVDLMRQLEVLQALPQNYFILELSSSLRHLQKETIAAKIPHLQHKIHWLSQLPKNFEGVVIANEVLDAMPVHRFMQTDQGIKESFIGLDADGQLIEEFLPCHNERLLNHIQTKLPQLDAPYLSEVNLFLDGWLKALAECIEKAAVLLIDYGFPRREYYHPDRSCGTLMCHYQHQAHTHFLEHLGEQDLTAHVDFTHVAEAGQDAGFEVAGYTNQASFLLANGLLSLLDDLDEISLFKEKQALKQLTLPHEMGELFKVMALTKQLDLDLQGFLLNDKRVSL
jgi:SAM-dependent MidA family methyltransferase